MGRFVFALEISKGDEIVFLFESFRGEFGQYPIRYREERVPIKIRLGGIGMG